MDTEKRLDDIEELVSNLFQDETVTELMIKALITTHPNPTAVKVAFQVLLTGHENALKDHGFSTGRPPGLVGRLQADLSMKAERWLGYFPPT